jgi:DNA-binding transcriptional LysR family regulator
LTESGKIFYDYAKRIIALCNEAVQAVCGVDNLTKGTLLVGASTIVGEYILPSHLASFKGIYPCIEISLKIGDSIEIIEDVIKGALEVGIVGAEVKRKELIFKDLIHNDLVLIVSSDHPWASKDMITIDQLKEESFLIRTEGSGTRMRLEKELEAAGLKEEGLNVAMSFRQY